MADGEQAIFLVIELRVHDQAKLESYVVDVVPMMARRGGEIVGFAPAPRVVEGDWRPEMLAVHRWRSEAAFEAFYASDEYAPLKRRREEACDARIVVVRAFR